MKLLLDTCVWGGAAETLRAAGHDVRWIGDTGPDPGDTAIMQLAADEGRILVTLDKDFGELAIVYGLPHCGIIRLVGLGGRQQGPSCVRLIERYRDELERGAIVTATPARVRIRAGDPRRPSE